MSRLRQALNRKQDDPYKGVVQAIRVDYTGEITHKADSVFSVLSQRVDAYLERLKEVLVSWVRSEVARQMPVIPPPQITEVHPITQVIEKPLERVVEKVVEERLIEADRLSAISVKRNKSGQISSLTRGGVVYRVIRDDDGLIKRVEAK